MNLKISTHEATESNRLILLLVISLTVALKEGTLDIEGTENLLFSPYTKKKLNDMGVDKNIIQIIGLGCELEDIESLIPEKLEESIDEILTMALSELKQLDCVKISVKKWVD